MSGVVVCRTEKNSGYGSLRVVIVVVVVLVGVADVVEAEASSGKEWR